MHASFKEIRNDPEIALLLDKIEKGVDLLGSKIDFELYCEIVYDACKVIHFEKQFENSSVDLDQFQLNIALLKLALWYPDDMFTGHSLDSEFKTITFGMFYSPKKYAIKFPNHVLK